MNEKGRDNDGNPIDWAANDAKAQDLVHATADKNGVGLSRRDIEAAATKTASDEG